MGARLTCVAAATSVMTVLSAATADTLHDNGGTWAGSGGISNGTEDAFGIRRTVLDDFTVPADRTWVIQGFYWSHVWNSLPPGSGRDLQIQIVTDFGGTPEDPDNPGNVLPIAVADVTSYSESGTGQTFFNRPGAESWVTFDDITLGAGTYWFEATIVGPENNFWLSTEFVSGAESWINYEDPIGLVRFSDQFGGVREPAWQLNGMAFCVIDLDRSGAIDFADLLALLSAWGPCPNQSGCPEDLDDDGDVGFSDLLIVLAAWGPCPQ